MVYPALKNKPLVEAIVEVKWHLSRNEHGIESDPHYKLLVGRLFERVQREYPVHEPLPAASVPDELVGQMVQHRFRASANGWPLLQLGPGIITVNDTSNYKWEDFSERALSAVDALKASHPQPSDLRPADVTLRYVDAVPFEFKSDDIFRFLKDKMGVCIDLPAKLFAAPVESPRPHSLVWSSSFRSTEPRGAVTLTFRSGRREDISVLVWEIILRSTGDAAPSFGADFAKWLRQAHDVTDDWFFKLIEGELFRRFSGD